MLPLLLQASRLWRYYHQKKRLETYKVNSSIFILHTSETLAAARRFLLEDSFEKTENKLYTKAEYYLNAALGVAVEILCPFLWEKIETENPLKRPEHLCRVYAFVGWLTKDMLRYVFNTVRCCFK